MRIKNIETVVMINNWLGREKGIAETFEIPYQTYTSCYNEETNHTIIDYVYYTEE